MIAGGQFRHHATVNGVQGYLAVQTVSQQTGVGVKNRNAGLVATRFNAQYSHGSPG